MELQKFWDTKPYTVVHEYDPTQSKNLFRFKAQQIAPVSAWSLIIGDAVHNARSALDYIAWTLGGSILDDTRTMFPICSHIEDFDKALKRRRLKNVHKDAITAIREFQPCLRPNVKESALWLLDELDRRDKHRLLTPVEMYPFPAVIEVLDPVPATILQRPRNGRLQNDAVIVEVPGAPNPDVKVRVGFAFDILFQRGVISASDDYEIRHCLGKIFEAVDQVIERFDWLLLRNPDWIKNIP